MNSDPERLKQLAFRFESLGGWGHGCEFGIFQRTLGAEPLGLLRWSDISPDKLCAALESKFDGIGSPEYTVVFEPPPGNNEEWWTRDTRYHMAMRTFIKVRESSYDEVVPKLLARLKFLREKLIRDLRAGDKIFVFRNMFGNLSASLLERLSSAVRLYGPNELLILQYADDEHAAGTVVRAREGLTLGYLKHFTFSPEEDKFLGGIEDALVRICQAALSLLDRKRDPFYVQPLLVKSADACPTLVFCTAFSDRLPLWELRYRRWLDALKASLIRWDQILIVDDGSPSLPDWPDLAYVQEGEEIPPDEPIVLYHFRQRLGRAGVRDYPGWYRSFCFAGSYGAKRGFKKVIHIESDCFLISTEAQRTFDDFRRGWASVQLPRYPMPESAIQVIAGDSVGALAKFCSVPYAERREKDIESVIPFTHIFTQLKGDRYGEILDYVPLDADWTGQAVRAFSTYYWWLFKQKEAPKGKRIVALSMVKNEQDIVEPFVRHTATYVDAHIILDNGSVDSTRKILDEMSGELPGLVITSSSEFGYTQSERMTSLLQACQSAFFADFVIFLDVDEFIGCSDRSEFENLLSRIPADGFGLIPWVTYVLNPEEVQEPVDPPRSMPWRRTTEQSRYNVVMRLDGQFYDDIIISQGNHYASSSRGRTLSSTRYSDLHLKHYPLRSVHQFIGKSIVGWMAYLAKDPDAERKGDGYHWKHNFQIATNGRGVSYREVCEISAGYDQPNIRKDWATDFSRDTPSFIYVRSLSSGTYCDPLTLVAKSWRASLLRRPEPLTLQRGDSSKLPMPSVGQPVTSAINPEWYWKNPYVDLAPFAYLHAKFRPASMHEIGCGIGAYVRYFQQLGLKSCLGWDQYPLCATALDEASYRRIDLDVIPLDAEKRDLVLCLELATLLPDEMSQKLLAFLDRLASNLIVFAAAEPGQPGVAHVNRLPIEQWLRRWQALGWSPELHSTLAARALSTLPWLRRNLVVLKRGIQADSEAGLEMLARIGRLRYQWQSIPPGIRSELDLSMVKSAQGYAPGARLER